MNPLIIKYLIIAAIVASMSAAIFYYKSKVNLLEAQAVTLQTQLAASQASVQQLSNDITFQNTAIDTLKADADLRLQRHKSELLTANNSRKQAELKAATILATVVPQGVNSCDAANQLINKEIK